MPTPVPLWFISGPGDESQAAWLERQLAARPAAETWAVLAGNAATTPAAAPGLYAERLGGCPCCSGAAALRVALVRLLRRIRPHRVLVLPPGPAHADPAAALKRDPWLAPSLEMTRIVLLTPETALALPEEALRDRLQHADRIVLLNDTAGNDTAGSAAIQRITAYAGCRPETAPAG